MESPLKSSEDDDKDNEVSAADSALVEEEIEVVKRENEEDSQRKYSDSEIESLIEDYNQRIANLERTERDTLRTEAELKLLRTEAALLIEKDEIINKIMAEGEELSKKQAAAQESAAICELRFQHQVELTAQRECYISALAAAKEAEALAEQRNNTDAKTTLEIHRIQAQERERMLGQAIQELRKTLRQKDQQAASREEAFRREIKVLQDLYRESERRHEVLIREIPGCTKPLLRQIKELNKASPSKYASSRASTQSALLSIRQAQLNEEEAEKREQSANETLSQTLSRINVLEAQILGVRAAQTELNRSLEKERQRATENRQDYLAVKEEADTQTGCANQLEEEIKELRRKHKQELEHDVKCMEFLKQELAMEKAARLELEKTRRAYANSVSDQPPCTSAFAFEKDSFSHWRFDGEASMSAYYTRSAFESALRQKEGELASYVSRLASAESIRDHLAEELVKMTAECEKQRAEAALLPGIRAELDALHRRHSAALELMGERAVELKELRADIIDLKEMLKEQVNELVNKIKN